MTMNYPPAPEPMASSTFQVDPEMAAQALRGVGSGVGNTLTSLYSLIRHPVTSAEQTIEGIKSLPELYRSIVGASAPADGQLPSALQGLTASGIGELAGSAINPFDLISALRAPEALSKLVIGEKGMQRLGNKSAEIQQIPHSGPGGAARMEIPDDISNYHLSTMPTRAEDSTDTSAWTRLGDIITHPKAFKAYPELADVRVGMLPMDNLGAYYSAYGNHIGMSDELDAVGVKNLLLHEIQHHIQTAEGWDPKTSIGLNYASTLAQAAREKAWQPEKEGARRYLMNYGEAEARVAQHRQDWTAAQRREIPFADHVAAERQRVEDLARDYKGKSEDFYKKAQLGNVMDQMALPSNVKKLIQIQSFDREL